MFIEPTPEAIGLLLERGIEGPVSMLNLLRFRSVADYSASPELAPDAPISGREAYDTYVEHTMPFLAAAGGSLQFLGEGGAFLIGPLDEQWDVMMVIRYPSLTAVLGMIQDPEYLVGAGHRTAALEDSRLLPVVASIE